MTITREQVADLREGDIVEYHREGWPAGTVLRGPLHRNGAGGWVAVGGFPVRYDNGEPDPSDRHQEKATLTVVSRVVPPPYVNHDRALPVPGDVVRDADNDCDPTTWTHTLAGTWRNNSTGVIRPGATPLARARLLVDGETGNGVPS